MKKQVIIDDLLFVILGLFINMLAIIPVFLCEWVRYMDCGNVYWDYDRVMRRVFLVLLASIVQITILTECVYP